MFFQTLLVIRSNKTPIPSKNDHLQSSPPPPQPPCNFFHYFFLTLIFSLRFLEYLKVTILLASRKRSFPVCGFLPRRDVFLFYNEFTKAADKDVFS